jgi:hypothetical protein
LTLLLTRGEFGSLDLLISTLTLFDELNHLFSALLPPTGNPVDMMTINNTDLIAVSFLSLSSNDLSLSKEAYCSIQWLNLTSFETHTTTGETPAVYNQSVIFRTCVLTSITSSSTDNSSRQVEGKGEFVVQFGQQSQNDVTYFTDFTLFSVPSGAPTSNNNLTLNQIQLGIMGQGSNLWIAGGGPLINKVAPPSTVVKIEIEDLEDVAQGQGHNHANKKNDRSFTNSGGVSSLPVYSDDNHLLFFYSLVACPPSPNLPVEYWGTVFVIQVTAQLNPVDRSYFLLQLK